MINRQMETYSLYPMQETNTEEFGAEDTPIKVKDIDVCITLKNGNKYNANSINIVEYDFLGLTTSEGIEKGMYLKQGNTRYDIQYVLPSRRFNQIFLKAVE